MRHRHVEELRVCLGDRILCDRIETEKVVATERHLDEEHEGPAEAAEEGCGGESISRCAL